MKVQANGLAIEVEDTGADGSQPDRQAVLLIMGLGMQLVAWPEAFVAALVAGGYRVVRFDNRDIGLSTHFDHLGQPNLMWEGLKQRLGLQVRAPYSVGDMAADALGVLDALGLQQAHVVGLSMGGMIAQRVALAAPQRVLSLTSIMSTSSARWLPGPSGKAARALLGRPRAQTEEAIADHIQRLFQVIGSPGYPTDPVEMRQQILRTLRRSYHPAGTARQLAAVVADGRRARELAGIQVRTLVLHGTDDPLVPVACGRDTARRIPGAQLVTVRGMGHDLSPGVVAQLLQPLLSHLR